MSSEPSARRAISGNLVFLRRSAVRGLAWAALGVVALVSAGCSGPAKVDYARPYPAKAQSGSIDVQLRRDEKTVSLTNTSARSFPESTLWLNAQFCRPLPALGVGETVSFDLSTFRNEFHEAFRAGGFFATERPDTIVLAQIELENELVGLVVVKGKP